MPQLKSYNYKVAFAKKFFTQLEHIGFMKQLFHWRFKKKKESFLGKTSKNRQLKIWLLSDPWQTPPLHMRMVISSLNHLLDLFIGSPVKHLQ